MTLRTCARLLLIGGMLLFVAPSAFACVCKPIVTLTPMRDLAKAKFAHADLVFEGTVLSGPVLFSKEAEDRASEYVIRVNRLYKGTTGDEVHIPAARSDCDPWFDLGRTYLIYAMRTIAGYSTSLCLGNHRDDRMAPDLRFLRGGPAAEGDLLTLEEYYWWRSLDERVDSGRVCGSIFPEDSQFPPGSQTLYLIPKNSSWRSGTFPIIRDISSYEMFCEEVPAGEYKISVTATAPGREQAIGRFRGAGSKEGSPWITVRKGEIRDDITIQLESPPRRTTTVQGVVDEIQLPIGPEDTLTAWLETYPGDPGKMRRSVPIDKAGRFVFEGIPPGYYRVHATYDGPLDLIAHSTFEVISTLEEASAITLHFLPPFGGID